MPAHFLYLIEWFLYIYFRAGIKMRIKFYIVTLVAITQATFVCQDFNTNKTGTQTFYFNDVQNRNQASFTSKALLETFSGLATDLWGEVSFDPVDVKNTIKGEIFISSSSIKTGLEMRDEALRSSGWLNAEEYPEISFQIKKVDDVTILDNNKLQLSLIGLFNCRGRSKEIMLIANLIFMEESNITKKRMPGDLLSVETEFSINLSDYGIRDMFIPTRVAEKIDIEVNIIGTNIKLE